MRVCVCVCGVNGISPPVVKYCLHSALGAAAVGGKLLVSGGYDGISSLNSVELYDIKTDV